LDPIDLLGTEATGASFKDTYKWQERISAHTLEGGATIQEVTRIDDNSIPGYLSWVMRFTPIFHTRRMLIETVDVALKKAKPVKVVLFGKGVGVAWHRDLAIKAIKTLAPDLKIVEFEDIVGEELKQSYLEQYENKKGYR